MKKLIRITTVPISLKVLLKGQLKFLKKHFEVIGISSPEKELEEASIFEGIKTYGVRMTRAITPIADLSSVFNLYKIFKKERPHIVHSHTPKAGTVSMLAAKLAGVKHRIHTVAGLPLLEVTGLKRSLLNSVEKATYACANVVLVNSEGLRQIIIKEGLASEKKLRVLGKGSSNGVSVDYFNMNAIGNGEIENLRTELNLNPTDTIFIFMGRMVSDKGVNEMVNAFNQISKQNNTIKLLLLGHREDALNPLHAETEKLINDNAAIIQTGFVSDVRPYLALSDVLILASYREGFPNVVLQAGAMSKPSIVSDINGCNEIIEDGYNGLIIPVKNTDALKSAIQKLIDDKILRRDMGANARLNIENNYSQKMIWAEILKFYKTLG